MPVETPSLFARGIQDRPKLKRQNATREEAMPLRRYKTADPFNNHPLFKTEEQARLEETMDGEQALPEERWVEPQPALATEDALWSRSRDFDWGD